MAKQSPATLGRQIRDLDIVFVHKFSRVQESSQNVRHEELLPCPFEVEAPA